MSPQVAVVNPKRRKRAMTAPQARALAKGFRARGLAVPARIRAKAGGAVANRKRHRAAVTVTNKRRRHRASASSNRKRKYRVAVHKVKNRRKRTRYTANKRRRRHKVANRRRRYRVNAATVSVGAFRRSLPTRGNWGKFATWGGLAGGLLGTAMIGGTFAMAAQKQWVGTIGAGVSWLGGAIILNKVARAPNVAYGWFVGGAIVFVFSLIASLIQFATGMADDTMSMDDLAALPTGEQVKELIVQGIGKSPIAQAFKGLSKDEFLGKEKWEDSTLSEEANAYKDWLKSFKVFESDLQAEQFI